jgi:hypothetical protein
MYSTMTNWEFTAMTDEMIHTIRTVYFPRMKSQGALDVYNIKTSETTGTVVSIWPDKDTADKAMEEAQSVRSDAAAKFDSKVVSMASGPVVAKG